MTPIRQTSPNPPATGGNLARIPSHEVPHAGQFFSPSRVLRRAPCSVRLGRDARSGRECGHDCKTANRADCMRAGRGLAKTRQRLPLPNLSLLHQSAHQFATDNANRNKSGSVQRFSGLGEAGAAGFLPSSPRPFPSLQVDNFTHWDGLIGSLVRVRESKMSPFHVSVKAFHGSYR